LIKLHNRLKDLQRAFNFLSSEEIEELCPYLELKEWQEDAVVMQKGDYEDYMGFIIEGRLAVKMKTGYWGKNIIIAILDRGAIVGEGAFLDSGPRGNSVIAMENCRLLTLTTQKMEELISNSPSLAIKLLKRMLYIQSLRLRKAGERISELL
jgi:CRP/FNR family cyclic AMP-dependent transcriptional regulator